MSLIAWAAAAALTTALPADAIDAYVRTQMERNHVPGAAVAIVRDGRLEKSSVYGVATLEWGQPVDQATAFQLASASKPLTGVLLMQLVDEGRLSLDDAVSKHLPDAPASWAKINVRQLATHTSGMATGMGPEFRELDTPAVTTTQQATAVIAKWPMAGEPGGASVYGIAGTTVLTAVMEKAGGKPFPAMLEERLLRPLGMNATRYAGGLDQGIARSGDVIPHRAGEYAWQGTSQASVHSFYPTWGQASGSLFSTAADLAKFFAALDQGRLVKPASRDAMWEPARLSNGRQGEYSPGWQARTYRGRRVVGHTGGGALADIVHYPDQKLTVIVLTNQQTMRPHLAEGIADLVMPPPPAPTHAILEDRDPALSRGLRSALEGAGDDALFAPEVQRTIAPLIRRLGPIFIAAHGPIRRFDLIEDTGEPSRRTRRYVAVYGDAPRKQMVATFTLTAEGRIAGWNSVVE